MSHINNAESLIAETEFANLFVGDVPMMDVRAPVEFERGAFPCSKNLPLLDNEQRHHIGIIYKQSGQQAAIAEGEAMATPDIRAQRVAQWREFAAANPGGALYCFRGGLRSQITRRWLADAGVALPLVAGGYKAMRSYLLAQLDELPAKIDIVLIAGRTGSGKTDFLAHLKHVLDLEGLARHRGSSFGATLEHQPSPISFENAVAVELLKHHRLAPQQPLFIEDEGKLIGRLRLPQALETAMAKAPLWHLECDEDQRITRIVNDYVVAIREAMTGRFGDDAAAKFEAFVLDNLQRISRRLGGERHAKIRATLSAAISQLECSGSAEGFREGVRMLLREYYDPMYDYQLQQRDREVIRRGDATALLTGAVLR